MSISSINFRQHFFHPFSVKLPRPQSQTIDLIDQKINIAARILFAVAALSLIPVVLGIQPCMLLGLGMLGYSVVHFYGITAYMKLEKMKVIDAFNKACRDGKIEVVRSYLKNGFVKIAGSNGHYALQVAAMNGHHEIILELLRNGADHQYLLKTVADDNETQIELELIDWAIKNYHSDLVLELFKKGVGDYDANEYPRFLKVMDFFDAKDVLKILDACPNLNVNPVSPFLTLLEKACSKNIKLMNVLLERGAIVGNGKRDLKDIISGLSVAASWNYVTIIDILLNAKAPINEISGIEQNTALHYAFLNDQEKAATVLIENGASLKQKNKQGFTPLRMRYELQKIDLSPEDQDEEELSKFQTVNTVISRYPHLVKKEAMASDPDLGEDVFNSLLYTPEEFLLIQVSLLEDPSLINFIILHLSTEVIGKVKADERIPIKYRNLIN